MRLVAILSVLILLLILSGKEALWRLHHPIAQAAVPSPNHSQVAEVRFMPEAPAVPYGSGVFLQSRWAVQRSLQAELVFAGYCSPIAAHWPSDQRLVIDCELVEGEARVFQPVVDGTAVEVALRPKQAASPSLNMIDPQPTSDHEDSRTERSAPGT